MPHKKQVRTPPTPKFEPKLEVELKSGEKPSRGLCPWCRRMLFGTGKFPQIHAKTCEFLYDKWAKKYPQAAAANPPPGATNRAARGG